MNILQFLGNDSTSIIDMKNLAEVMSAFLFKHHELYDHKCQGKASEELFSKALNKLNYHNEYKYGHNSEYDIQLVNDGTKIQIKSGTINLSNNTLKFSGHRTTSCPSIDEKIKFIEANKPDIYIFLATDSKFDKERRYFLCSMKTENISFLGNWHQKNKDFFMKNETMTCEISYKLSEQLWATINLGMLDYIEEISV